MILARVKLWAGLIGAAILGALGLMAKSRRDGRKIEQSQAKEKDRAQADAIRRRVDAVSRPSGVRPDDKRGFRD